VGEEVRWIQGDVEVGRVEEKGKGRRRVKKKREKV
jgi:hypothetical protein